MSSLTSILKTDEITPLLRKLEKGGPALRKVAAHAAARCTREHFAGLAGSRHRSGVAFNFYADAARKTTGIVRGDDVVVVVDKIGIGLRVFGGTVKPTGGKKYLTIPDAPEAQGKTAREFGKALHFRRNKNGDSGRLTDNTGRVFFWLVKKTEHKADPTVLPTPDDYVKAITPEVDAQLERMTNGR